MLKNLKEQYKFYLIIGGFLIALFICHKLAFSSTFELRRSCRDLNGKLEEVDRLPVQLAELNKNLAVLDKQYFENKTDLSDNHEYILDRISESALRNNVSVHDYPPKHNVRTANLNVETHIVVLEGRFIHLVKTLYDIEVKEKLGRMVSVKFFSETERRSKRTSLYVQVFIQNYKNTNGNEKSN